MNAQENSHSVQTILDYLRDGLGSFVLKEYKRRYFAARYLDELQDALSQEHPFEDEEQASSDVDLQGWLLAMERQWREVFRTKLSTAAQNAKSNSDVADARSFLYELRNARNRFAHPKKNISFIDEDVYRLADTATRILTVTKAKAEATNAQAIRLEYGKKIYGIEESAEETIKPEPPSAPPSEPMVKPLHEPTQRIDLRGARLLKMDFRNRNLRFAILSSAKLSGSNLRDEDLSEVKPDHATLTDVDLTMANLANAELSKANLESSHLSHANLSRANLHLAIIRHVNMEFANLQFANLKKAYVDGANLRYADLSYADLTGANLVGADFRGAIMRGARLEGAKLNWEGFAILNKEKYRVSFDTLTILPDGSNWTPSANMIKFTGPLDDN